MNSDQIRARFGSYGVEVLGQTSHERLANLYSQHGGLRICRTLALTHFLTIDAPELEACHNAIVAGASIGVTLRRAGWTMEKTNAVTATTLCGTGFSSLTAGTVQPGVTIAIKAYTLQISKASGSVDYATIAEAYHPQHVSPSADTTGSRTRATPLSDRTTQETLNALIGTLSAPSLDYINRADSARS